MFDIDVMSDKLFYCKSWDDIKHTTKVKGYKILVSDVVYGNYSHSSIQVHIAVVKLNYNTVIKAKALTGKGQVISCIRIIEQIESIIRECLSDIVSWKGESPDDDIVKIWYYRPEDDPSRDDKGEPCSDIYLRIAATAVDVCLPDDNMEQQITNKLREHIGEYIKQIV